MDDLSSFFISKPFNILAIAIAFLAAYLVIRFSALSKGKSAMPILITGIVWSLYAAWEWTLLSRSPTADIRIDLLLIWPFLTVLSLWAVYKLLR